MEKTVIQVEFITIYTDADVDDGQAKLNLKTGEVFDIKKKSSKHDEDDIVDEYISLNGVDFSLNSQSDIEDNPDKNIYKGMQYFIMPDDIEDVKRANLL